MLAKLNELFAALGRHNKSGRILIGADGVNEFGQSLGLTQSIELFFNFIWAHAALV